MQVGLAQPQHHRRQRESLVVVAHVAQVRERDEIAARGRTGQARQLRHFGDGQARALLVKRFDDLQALFQTGDQVALEGPLSPSAPSPPSPTSSICSGCMLPCPVDKTS
jgi:hypothetical protein